MLLFKSAVYWFCLDVLSISVSGILKFPTIVVMLPIACLFVMLWVWWQQHQEERWGVWQFWTEKGTVVWTPGSTVSWGQHCQRLGKEVFGDKSYECPLQWGYWVPWWWKVLGSSCSLFSPFGETMANGILLGLKMYSAEWWNDIGKMLPKLFYVAILSFHAPWVAAAYSLYSTRDL